MRNELKVGIFFIVSMVFIFIFIFVLKDVDLSFGDLRSYVIRFYSVDGLRVNSFVKIYGGIVVGKVKEVDYDNFKARVHVSIFDDKVNDMLVDRKSKFRISSAGIVGGKYLLLEFDVPYSSYIFSKSYVTGEVPVIEGYEQVSIDKLLEKGNDFVSSLNKIFESHLDEILDIFKAHIKDNKINEFFLNVLSFSKKMNLIADRANNFLNNLDSFVLNAQNRFFDNLIKNVSNNVDRVSEEIIDNSRIIKKLLGNFNKFVTNIFSDERKIPLFIDRLNELSDSFNKLITKADKLMDNFNDIDTPVGILMKDKKIKNKLYFILDELGDTILQIKNSTLFSNFKKKSKGNF